MVYNVIGIMSGSSLDGLDIAFVKLDENRGKWSFEIEYAECLPYSAEWTAKLKRADEMPVGDFLKLHTTYGRYIGEQVNNFIERNSIHHKVHFIASHGHTVFHEPHNDTTCQIGDGAAIAAVTGLPIISDLRSLDVALGGQGAPIVPIGDKLLFSEYTHWLNIGGIANVTIRKGEELLAFDICPANQILNTLAGKLNKSMDEGGEIARSGLLLIDVLAQMNTQEYYEKNGPKSLSNEAAVALVFPTLLESKHSVADMLHTMVRHIAEQVAKACKTNSIEHAEKKMLITGGGAFNTYLVEEIQKQLTPLGISVHVPDEKVVKYKEALVMALIGALRWREECNVLSSVTGASKDSIGGALWMGQN
jgi:anhydro-N-acetylmuramic acid kinase